MHKVEINEEDNELLSLLIESISHLMTIVSKRSPPDVDLTKHLGESFKSLGHFCLRMSVIRGEIDEVKYHNTVHPH